MPTNNAWNSTLPVSTVSGGTGSSRATGTLLSYTTYTIDATTMGSKGLFTTETIGNFTPVMICFQPTTVTTFATAATISIGTNSASYNNILAASPLTGLSVVNTVLNFPLSVIIPVIASGTQIFANVSVGAVATAYTIQITVLGFYS